MHSKDSGSIIVKLDRELLNAIDRIREEWGIRSRADIVERILREVLTPDLVQEKSSDSE
jgi:metal-responsive CopG/Arc/MetJ family transcriptional regulator